ncbi:MAG: nucleotide exchange factor GrpE [archaeon]
MSKHPQSKENKEKTEVEEKVKEIKDLTYSLQRLQAEFENYKKRTEREKQEFIEHAYAGCIASLLPVIDSFNQVIKHSKDEGIKRIHSQLTETLEKLGLKEIKCEGKKFDYLKHDAVMQKETIEKEKDEVIEEVVQKGFEFKGKVLRHAKVIILKFKEKKEEEREGKEREERNERKEEREKGKENEKEEEKEKVKGIEENEKEEKVKEVE